MLPEDEIGTEYRLLGRTRGSGLSGFSKQKARQDNRSAAARVVAGLTEAMPA